MKGLEVGGRLRCSIFHLAVLSEVDGTDGRQVVEAACGGVLLLPSLSCAFVFHHHGSGPQIPSSPAYTCLPSEGVVISLLRHQRHTHDKGVDAIINNRGAPGLVR